MAPANAAAAAEVTARRFVSIEDACEMLGGISRSTWYRDIAPSVQTIKLARRRLVLLESLEAVIASYLDRSPA